MVADATVGARPGIGDLRTDLVARGRVARFAVLLTTGLLSGLLGIARTGHLAGGLAQVVLFGAAYGAAASFVTGSRLRQLRGLSRADRLHVVQLVRRGTAPDDPRLAKAALEYVRSLRRGGVDSGPMVALTLLAAGLLALAVAVEQPLILAAEGGIVGAWQAMLPPLRRRHRDVEFSIRHFAEREARTVLRLPPESAGARVVSPARVMAMYGLALVTAVVVGAQAVNFVTSLPRPHSEPSVLDTDPAREGYAKAAAAAGTQVWFRRSGRVELSVRATGAVDEVCSVSLDPLDTGKPNPYLTTDVDACAGSARRNGSVLVFEKRNGEAHGSLQVSVGPAPRYEDLDIGLGRFGVPGSHLVVFVLPGRGEVSGYLP